MQLANQKYLVKSAETQIFVASSYVTLKSCSRNPPIASPPNAFSPASIVVPQQMQYTVALFWIKIQIFGGRNELPFNYNLPTMVVLSIWAISSAVLPRYYIASWSQKCTVCVKYFMLHVLRILVSLIFVAPRLIFR